MQINIIFKPIFNNITCSTPLIWDSNLIVKYSKVGYYLLLLIHKYQGINSMFFNSLNNLTLLIEFSISV